MEYIGLHHLGNFKKVYLQRMLDNGTLVMTEPDNPTSRNQKYVNVPKLPGDHRTLTTC